jgi:hypothetical protein
MPATVWLLLIAVILVLIGTHVTESMVKMGFYILALVTAVVAVWRLIG